MPFITPPSPYLILGSNILGGAPNLIVNNGINNMALGNFVLTNNNNGDNNIAIGNLAMNAHVNGESNVAIGFSSLVNTELNQENVMLGAFVAAGSQPYFDSVIIGVNAGAFSQLQNDGSLDNVVIGHNAMFGSDETPLDFFESNVIVGAKAMRQELGVSPNLSVVGNVIVGANVLSEVESTVENNIVIGGEALTDLNQLTNSNVVVGYNAASFNTGGLLAEPAFSENILIGTEVALKNEDEAGDQLFTLQNQIAIGIRALAGMQPTDYNMVLGRNSLIGYLPSDNTIYSVDARAEFNNVIGSNSAQINSNISGGETSYINNIILGNDTLNFNTSDGLTKIVSDNIVIGNTCVSGDDYNMSNAIIIGNNNPDPVTDSIIIGDPNVTYTQILVGGVDLLNISGGLEPVATQTADTDVSITSVANDGVSDFTGSYFLNATSDNSTISNSIIQIEAGGNDGSGNFSGTATLQSSATNGIGLTEFILSASGNGGIGAGATFSASTDNATNDEVATLNLNGQTTLTIALNTNLFVLQAPASAGTNAPDFTQSTAPVAGLTVTNWMEVTFNGVAGYIPFLSA